MSRRSPLVLLAALAIVGAPATAEAAKPKPKRPDLRLAPLKVPAKTVRAGDRLQLRFTVLNRGRRKAGKSVVGFFLSADTKRNAADVALGRVTAKAVRVRKRTTGRARLRVPATARAGRYRVLACADVRGRVREANERNNCVVTPVRITVRAKPVAPGVVPPPPARPSPETGNLPPAPAPLPDPGGGGPDPQPQPQPQPDPDLPPPDPAKVAPDLPTQTAASMATATKFLYTGPNAVQRGVAPGAIDDQRVAVVRGRVLDRVGAPISGVRVTVLDHPELGSTLTRDDGRYDLAVNGGGLVLTFEAAGFLTAQRQLSPDWRDWEVAEDLTMVPVDPAVTLVRAGAAAQQVALGTATRDSDGTRRGLLVFAPGTNATMKLPDGTTKPLTDMHVRITEFTVGDEGDRAMPASLPPTTGYTYAAEFSVDEALAARATEVTFDKPVANYVQNFIGAGVGTNVPTGHLDRLDGQWKAGPNGRVVKITDEVDGKAVLQGAAGLTIPDDELRVLAQQYAPGQELWRVPLHHFTPWDHNWPFGPPPGAKGPQLKEFVWTDPNDPCRAKGSTIGCETGTLGETVPIAGTPYTINYSNDRTPGWRSDERLQVPVTTGEVHERLKGIQLTIDLAGKEIVQRWCDPDFPTTGTTTCGSLPEIKPNTTYTVAWDGRDAYGREVQGRVQATIRVIYVYEFNYYESADDFSASFSALPSDTQVFDGRGACGNVSGSMETHFFCGIPVGQTITRMVGSWDHRPVGGLGGWSIDAHHAYDPEDGVVHLGDGTDVRSEAMGTSTRTIAGGIRGPRLGSDGAEGKPATEVNFDYLGDMTRGPDGSTYVSVWFNEFGIFKVGADGRIRRFAGFDDHDSETRDELGPPSGDGGPALEAKLGGPPDGLTVGPDGSLWFIVQPSRSYPRSIIRRITPDGKIHTVAGTLEAGSKKVDGKGPRDTALSDPKDLLATADGSIYWGERPTEVNGYEGLVRRLTPSGTVETVAGGGADATETEDLGDGEPARNADFGVPYGLAQGEDGSILFALPNDRIVVRVRGDGRLQRVAGNRSSAWETPRFGDRAVEANIGHPTDVAVGPDGELYVRHDQPAAASDSLVSRVTADGRLQPAYGLATGSCGYSLSQDGEPALRTCLEGHSPSIHVDPDGTLVVADGRYLVRTLEPVLPGFGASSLALPSPDGAEVWDFSAEGRHKRTLDGLTGAVLRTFGYDGGGRLATITDRDGNVTTIERDAAGTPTAIVAPGGQRTTLAVGAGGWLASITDPTSRTTQLSYDASGLLTRFRRPGGGTSLLEYDALGRLVKDVDPDGVVTTVERTEADGDVTSKVTVGGRVTTYRLQALDSGDRERTITRPGGRVTKLVMRPDGTQVRTDPDGTTTTVVNGADPRWGARVTVPVERTTRTPGGVERKETWSRWATLAQPRNPLAVESLRVAHDDGEATTSWRYEDGDAANPDDQSMEIESAERRRTRTVLDRRARPIRIELGELPTYEDVLPITITYDARGRVTQAAQGTTRTVLAYDAQNRLVRREDGAGGALEYGYDAADRTTRVTIPGGGSYTYTYDADGDVATLTTPEGRRHEFTHTPAGRDKAWKPAGQATSYLRAYDGARELESVTTPSAAVRDFTWDAAGLLTADADPQATRTYEHAPGTDQWRTLTWTRAGGAAQQLVLGHDGVLPTSEASPGGTVTTAWGAGFLPTGRTIAASGQPDVTQALGFDDDRLLTTLGRYTLERRGPGGAFTGALNGTELDLDVTHDALARPKTRTLEVGGTVKYAETLTYDAAGRISAVTESPGGTRTYAHDGQGRLTGIDGTPTWSYDRDGNRLSGGAKYDAGGRLTEANGKTYDFDADGFLTRRGTDTFTYARGGELLSATVGGTTVAYAYDALGRRTSRTQGGQTERYLYGDPANPLRPTAWVAPGGTVSTLLYGGDGELFAIERGDSRFYVGTDHLGSPRVITDSAGTVLRTIRYDPFGVVTDAGDAAAFPLPIGFAGGLSDPLTGLVRFGARDYEPETGRFTARDPSGFSGSPDNLYAYAGSSPVSTTDPTGLACLGFSAYGGAGGGIQVCRDNDLDKGDWSLCGEIGVGVGGGPELDLTSGAADTGGTIVAEITGKAGWAQGTIGAEMSLDCFNVKGQAKVGLGPVVAGVDTSGTPGVTVGPAEKVGAKLEGKVAWKQCAKF